MLIQTLGSDSRPMREPGSLFARQFDDVSYATAREVSEEFARQEVGDA